MNQEKADLSYRFPWQRIDEEVKIVMRGFLPAVLIPVMLIAFGFFGTAIFVLWFIQNQVFYFIFRELINTVLLVWLGGGVLWMFYLIYEWLFDICVVTNQRIIDIDQQGFFHQKVSESGLNKVQDVVYEIKGFIQTFFNFGNVTVYTAGNEQGFTFENVHNPQKMHQRILDIVNCFSDEQDQPVTARELFEYFKEKAEGEKKSPANSDKEIDNKEIGSVKDAKNS